MFKLIRTAALAAAILSAPTAASAVQMLATYSGTLDWGDDYGGVFGDAFVSGAAFTATFTYDTDLGTITTWDDWGAGQQLGVFGEQPITRFTLTIGGVTDVFADFGSKTDQIDDYAGVGSTGEDRFVHHGFSGVSFANIFDYAWFDFVPDADAPTRLDQPYFSTGSGSGSVGRGGVYDPGSGSTTGYARYEIGGLNIHSVRIETLTSAVPEPATWAMLILGFFGMGAVLRRRDRQRLSPA